MKSNESASMTRLRLERTVEEITGASVAELRRRSREEQRAVVEAQYGSKMRFVSRFPMISRGHVLRDRVKTHEEIKAMFDEALRWARNEPQTLPELFRFYFEFIKFFLSPHLRWAQWKARVYCAKSFVLAILASLVAGVLISPAVLGFFRWLVLLAVLIHR